MQLYLTAVSGAAWMLCHLAIYKVQLVGMQLAQVYRSWFTWTPRGIAQEDFCVICIYCLDADNPSADWFISPGMCMFVSWRQLSGWYLCGFFFLMTCQFYWWTVWINLAFFLLLRNFPLVLCCTFALKNLPELGLKGNSSVFNSVIARQKREICHVGVCLLL